MGKGLLTVFVDIHEYLQKTFLRLSGSKDSEFSRLKIRRKCFRSSRVEFCLWPNKKQFLQTVSNRFCFDVHSLHNYSSLCTLFCCPPLQQPPRLGFNLLEYILEIKTGRFGPVFFSPLCFGCFFVWGHHRTSPASQSSLYQHRAGLQ